MPAQQVLRIFFKLFPPFAFAVQSDSVRRPTTIFSILKNTSLVSTPPTLATNSCSSQILLRT